MPAGPRVSPAFRILDGLVTKRNAEFFLFSSKLSATAYQNTHNSSHFEFSVFMMKVGKCVVALVLFSFPVKTLNSCGR